MEIVAETGLMINFDPMMMKTLYIWRWCSLIDYAVDDVIA